MRVLPQELLDMVIDKLAEPPGPFEPITSFTEISEYSTVSRQWLIRTQKHHFEFIFFTGQDDLERWRTTIKADPSGVSRHAREMLWQNIHTLKGFEEHIAALTRVKQVELSDCDILCSLPDVGPIVSLGSSLVKLGIDGGLATPRVMASVLAGLPNLHYLVAHGLRIEHDHNNTIPFPSSIPFFEGSGDLNLGLVEYSPGKLDWVPPTARFGYLRIDALCIHDLWARVGQWITSSGGNLKYLSIELDFLGTCSLQLNIVIDHPPLTVWFPSRLLF